MKTIASITSNISTPNSIFSPSFQRTWDILADTVPATFLNVLPNAIRWLYRTKISRQITSFPLKTTIDKTSKVATLYLHGLQKKSTQPLLLLHGDHGHPYTMLHLADAAAKNYSGTIFSLYMPSEKGYSDISRSLLEQAIEKIELMVKSKEGSFSKIVTLGHSKGAIQAAHQAFVEKDERIKSVISIAGRLKNTQSLDKACHEILQPTVNEIAQAIITNPDLPLYQIVAENDWCVPLDASRVNLKNSCVVPGAGHLNVLYRHETIEAFIRALA